MEHVALDGGYSEMDAQTLYERYEHEEWRDWMRHQRLRRMRLRRHDDFEDWWAEEMESVADRQEEHEDE